MEQCQENRQVASHRLYCRRKTVETQQGRKGCWNRGRVAGTEAPGVPVDGGPGFASARLPARRAGAPRRWSRRRRGFLLPDVGYTHSLRYAPQSAAEAQRIARSHRRESVLRRVRCSSLDWLLTWASVPARSSARKGNPLRKPGQSETYYDNVTWEITFVTAVRSVAQSCDQLSCNTRVIIYTWIMSEWVLFAIVDSRSVNPTSEKYRAAPEILKELRNYQWTSEHLRFFFFTFLGMSRGKVKWNAGGGIRWRFSNLPEVWMFVQRAREIFSVEDSPFANAPPFEGARLFTGETTRVSWTPVKLAYELEPWLNASVVGDDVQVSHCRRLKFCDVNLIKRDAK